MAGTIKHSKEFLNKTLLFIAQLFAQHNVNNWFISYGTLLGIIRDDSCIDKDDDVDVMCDIAEYDKIKQLLIDNGFTFEKTKEPKRRIIKTNNSNEYASIDFYMADLDEKGNFNDEWNHVMWSNCYCDGSLIKMEWKGVNLYVPHNYEIKLIGRYGKNWKIPANTKGQTPWKKVL